MSAAGERRGELLGGKYRLEGLLAQGGMGLVYAARHELTGRALAVKVLRPELALQPDMFRRVAGEARLAVRATHPNVVEVIDTGLDARGCPFVVLERLYGETLEAALNQPLSLRATLQVLVPVMNALVALHAAGIVHRDLKPANLFLSRDPSQRVTPKLLDFGIAKALEHTGGTRSGVALGTPAYMAPEQLLGCASLGPSADVWSMGVVMVRCLTGKLPYDGAVTARVGTWRNGLCAEDLGDLPPALARCLVQALKPEPSERYARMADFRDALVRSLPEPSAGGAWPGPDTVSFAATETEFARRLPLPPEPAPGSRLAQPRTSRTRTLPGVRRSRGVGLRRRWWLLAALPFGLWFAASVTFRSRSAAPGSQPAVEQSAALLPASAAPSAGAPAVPSSEPREGLAPSRLEPPASEVSSALPTPTPLASAPDLAAARSSRRSVANARTPVPPAVPAQVAADTIVAPQASERPEAPVPRSPALGANRSPIIE